MTSCISARLSDHRDCEAEHGICLVKPYRNWWLIMYRLACALSAARVKLTRAFPRVDVQKTARQLIFDIGADSDRNRLGMMI